MKQSLLDTWLSAPDDAFEAFFELAPVFMFSATADWKIARASRYWSDALGVNPVDLPGKSVLDLMTADSRRKAQTETLPRFTETRLIEGAEFDFIRADGSILPVVLSARTQIDDTGRVLRVLAIMFDNSEARAAQAALRAAIAEAKEANRAKSRFLAAMSHEIRTPMNAILGFAQLLKMSDLDDRRRTHVDAIQSAGGTLMTLLTDLLDLSQFEAGRMRIAAEAFDLDELLDQLADWWETGAAEKGLRLRIAKDKGLPRRIVSDKGRLQQVLNNYLGNAVKFTESGRITLAIEEIAQDGARRRIRFEVTDTGPGMTAAQTEQLFKPFVQVGSYGSKERGGWGLGLSICHEIASAMNGTVGVRSELGSGSTFFFEVDVDTLPDDTEPADPPQRPATAGAAPAPAPADGLSILVAEDNPMSRVMMQEMLTELGHKVTTTPDGLAALRAIEARPYDLVFMDVMMPQLDGISATRRIRSGVPPRARTPIIGCSAHTADAASYRAAGMDEFLPKPVDRTRLQDLIRQFTPGSRRPNGTHAE
jgi:PAS domain S-box-containing protein